jgi:hypothetical protein
MRRPVALLLASAALALLAAGCGGKTMSGGGGGGERPGPALGAKGTEKEAAADLGFPGFATKNTTRVGGADAVADAAAVARAVYPGGPGPRSRPRAVTLVDSRDWRAGVAAAVLAGPPLRAPTLLSDGADLPQASGDALAALAPTGARAAGGAQVIRIGDVARPSGLRATTITGSGPFALARAVDAFAAAAHRHAAEDVVIASADDPGYAMPAAGWAAKSGDPVLFVQRDRLPAETVAALKTHRRPRIYVLGPPATISGKVVAGLRRLGSVTRVGTGDAVRTSIDFARFVDGDFGWGIVDPGHGLVFARGDRPLDAAAAAPLSAAGTYGPLILVSSRDRLDQPVADFLLDIQPGYTKDPVRGVYNHGWIVGDDRAIAIPVQSQIDGLLEISPVNTRRAAGPQS